jgi:hypothetical protein
MITIFAVALGFLALGSGLASGWNPIPLRPGYLGGALLIAAALVARHVWQKRAATGHDPGAAERRAWLYMSGSALIFGFVTVVLMTPGSEVHRGTGDTGGYDSWVMLAAGALAWWLLHDGEAPVDERDRAIDNHANRVGYTTLIVCLLVFLLTLGFAPKDQLARFTHWLIANSLLNLLTFTCMVQYLAQLLAYWRDARHLAAEG